jgi:hypothetical protein
MTVGAKQILWGAEVGRWWRRWLRWWCESSATQRRRNESTTTPRAQEANVRKRCGREWAASGARNDVSVGVRGVVEEGWMSEGDV